MIRERIENMMNLSGINKLMIFDHSNFGGIFDYTSILKNHGFKIVPYTSVEAFRLEYEETLKTTTELIAVIVKHEIYVPYDIQQNFRKVNLSLGLVFPKLHADTLSTYARDVDLISFAYDSCYADAKTSADTEDFIHNTALSEAMISRYCMVKMKLLKQSCETTKRYTDWIEIAKSKAAIHYYAVMASIDIDLSFSDEGFMQFIESSFASLSSELGASAPAIVTKTLKFISETSWSAAQPSTHSSNPANRKIALVVMDGMSLFDFEVISRYFTEIEYEVDGTFALIPTTTPISRQSLLSGKYPRELEKPFSLVNEERGFILLGEELGYAKNQIQYLRGYEPNISQFAKFITVIINDVDEIVHGQRQERIGVYNDMQVLGKSGKLQGLVKMLVSSGFEVHITSDHGNTPCVGVGGFRSGVEMQSKSMRMVVLKDFAEEHTLLKKFTIEYSGTYLDKSFKYFVCEPGFSFDSKGESVMTHGGMTIDEVIVPFVKIKGVR